MLNEVKQHFFKKLIEDTFGYYRIYDCLKIRLRQAFSSTSEFHSNGDFWQAILHNDFKYDVGGNPTLRNNQIVVLKDFFLSEWVPKLPGRVWTHDGDQNLISGLQDIIGDVDVYDHMYRILGPEGKGKVVTGGFGSVRIKPRVNNDYCTLLCAVSRHEWHCDYGIPIVVSKAVYDDFLRYSHDRGAPWIEELRGVLVLNNSVGDMSPINPAIGARLEKETIDLLSDMPNLQKCFIYVSSPLDITLKYNNSHPDAVGWTMFKTDIANEPYRLTYSTFEPLKNGSIKEAVDFINTYVFAFNGTEILTDFDGQKRRLVSKSNLGNTKNFNWEHSRAIRGINQWIRKESSETR